MVPEIAVQLVGQSSRVSGFASCSFPSVVLVDIASSISHEIATLAERSHRQEMRRGHVVVDSVVHPVAAWVSIGRTAQLKQRKGTHSARVRRTCCAVIRRRVFCDI